MRLSKETELATRGKAFRLDVPSIGPVFAWETLWEFAGCCGPNDGPNDDPKWAGPWVLEVLPADVRARKAREKAAAYWASIVVVHHLARPGRALGSSTSAGPWLSTSPGYTLVRSVSTASGPGPDCVA